MAGVFAIAGLFMWPNVPQAQVLRLHLGAGSSNISDVVARVRRHDQSVWDREASWHFPRGAPAAFPWSFELPAGSADLEVEVSTSGPTGHSQSRVLGLELRGGETSVELRELVQALDVP